MNFGETIFEDKIPHQYYYLDYDQELYFFYMSQFEKSEIFWESGNGNYLGFNDKKLKLDWNPNLIFNL